jgi:hypothetical protein
MKTPLAVLCLIATISSPSIGHAQYQYQQPGMFTLQIQPPLPNLTDVVRQQLERDHAAAAGDPFAYYQQPQQPPRRLVCQAFNGRVICR